MSISTLHKGDDNDDNNNLILYLLATELSQCQFRRHHNTGDKNSSRKEQSCNKQNEL
jgi:hypothetical protein